jgi:hypothetical protein
VEGRPVEEHERPGWVAGIGGWMEAITGRRERRFLLEVVVDYTRLSAVLAAGDAGRERASRPQYPGFAHRRWPAAPSSARLASEPTVLQHMTSNGRTCDSASFAAYEVLTR